MGMGVGVAVGRGVGVAVGMRVGVAVGVGVGLTVTLGRGLTRRASTLVVTNEEAKFPKVRNETTAAVAKLPNIHYILA